MKPYTAIVYNNNKHQVQLVMFKSSWSHKHYIRLESDLYNVLQCHLNVDDREVRLLYNVIFIFNGEQKPLQQLHEN